MMIRVANSSFAFVLVFVTLLNSGCARSSQNASIAENAGRVTTVDEALQALADAGVAVFDSPRSPSPIRPVRAVPSALALTRLNLENMVDGVNAGTGAPGAGLDRLAPMPKNGIALSFLLAAWVSAYRSPGAAFARRLMGTRDWHSAPAVIFPTLVIALFVADAARPVRQPAHAFGAGATLAMSTLPVIIAARAAQRIALDLGDLCEIRTFEDKILESIFDAIRLKESSGLFGFFASLINTAAALTKVAVKNVLAAAQAPLLAAFQHGIAILSLVQFATSHWSAWKITFEHHAGTIDLAAPPSTATFVAHVDTHGFVFPPAIVKCAQALDPNAGDLNAVAVADAKVSWAIVAGPEFVHSNSNSGPALSPQRSSTLTFEPRTFPSIAGCTRRSLAQIEARFSVDPGIGDMLTKLIANLLLDELPPDLQTFIGANVEAERKKLAAALEGFTVSKYDFAGVSLPVGCPPPPSPIPSHTKNPNECL